MARAFGVASALSQREALVCSDHNKVFVSLELRSTTDHDGRPCLGEVKVAGSLARDELDNDDARRVCSLGILHVR